MNKQTWATNETDNWAKVMWGKGNTIHRDRTRTLGS